MVFYPEKFKRIREMRGLTQDDIANAIDYKRQAVQRWEKGKTAPRPKQVPRLAQILKCSIRDISDLMPSEELARELDLKSMFPDCPDISELEFSIIKIFLSDPKNIAIKNDLLKKSRDYLYKNRKDQLNGK